MHIFLQLVFMLIGLVLGSLATWLLGRHQTVELFKRLKNAIFERDHVSINEEFLMTQELANIIKKDDFKPNIIYAICPGGAMVAEWLSRRFLGTRSKPVPVQIISMEWNIKKYAGQKIGRAEVRAMNKIPEAIPKESKILLVNDISRGGNTLQQTSDFLAQYFSEANIRVATLICYRDATYKPTYYAAETRRSIEFEWKTYDDDTNEPDNTKNARKEEIEKGSETK